MLKVVVRSRRSSRVKVTDKECSTRELVVVKILRVKEKWFNHLLASK